MVRYKIVKKGLFETHANFEERVNTLAIQGWKAVSISAPQGNQLVVLMEKS